jgi:large subunit ribosomal protein L17
MRHHNANRKFGREKTQRNALLRTLAVSLISKEKIKTTEAKAKELRPYVEKVVTKAKANTLAARRYVTSVLGTTAATGKMMEIIAPKYADRQGGYTRIVKTERRNNDAAKMAIIEFV